MPDILSGQNLPLLIEHARRSSDSPRRDNVAGYRSIGQLLADRAAAAPGKTFLIWYDGQGARGELTYSQTLGYVQSLAADLVGKGYLPGDRIGTFSGNYPETVLTYLTCWSLGLTVVPLSTGEDDARLAYIVQNAGIKLIFTRPELQTRLNTILAAMSPSPHVTFAPSASASASPPSSSSFPALTRETSALIVYTSGTTGHPKGVVLDHYNLLTDALALSEWHGIKSDSRMMCVLPIHHVNGTVVTILTPLMAGSSLVLNEKFSVQTFFPRLAAEEVAVVSVVPTLLAFLLEADAPVEGLDLTKLHHIICGAGPLTVDLAQRFESRYGIPIAHGYGLSETTCYSCCLPVDLSDSDRQRWLSESGYPSIGPAFPCNEMVIFDSNNQPVEAGVRGEIVIRGHNVMEGYFGNNEANLVAFSGGWFHSGDEGFWLPNESGVPYYFITGRLKELIIRGGVNISPLEIDEVLMAIPGLRAGIAVGFEHDLYGEEVGAAVIRAAGSSITDAEVIAACRKKLPAAKSPKVVIFVESLPVTSTGKYQRRLLKPLFVEWKTARFR